MQELGNSFIDRGKILKEASAGPPILGPNDTKLSFEERFNIVKAYLKSEDLSKWSLSVIKVSDKEFIIYQGSFTNIWARFRDGKGVLWNHERLNRRMHRDLPPEIFEDI